MPTAVKGQLQQRAHTTHTEGTMKHLAQGTRETVLLGPTDTYCIRPFSRGWEMQHIYLIHKNKHRELVKMRRQACPHERKVLNSRKGTK